MIAREALLLSVRSLARRPAESLLLIVSVALAVGATVAVITLAGTAATISERLLSSFRYREIVVSTRVESSAMKLPARARLPNSQVPNSVAALTPEDLHQARSVSPAVQYAYIANRLYWRVTEQEAPRPQRRHLTGMAVTPEFFAARNLMPAAGSLFTAADLERGEPVMVLGSQLGATLFEDGTALDRTVAADSSYSGDRRYRIVGVLERSGGNEDLQAFIPVGFRATFSGHPPEGIVTFKGSVTFHHADERSLRFTAADRQSLPAAREQLTRYFDATYGEGLLHVSDPREGARQIADRFRRLARVVLFLASSALLIATLYMTSIFSSRALRRRRSAGILKAMGAASTGVFAVFAVEAAAVGAVGGAAGVALAALLAGVIERAIGVDGFRIGLVLAGLATAWTIVSACSLLPASAAARAPATEAIRYE